MPLTFELQERVRKECTYKKMHYISHQHLFYRPKQRERERQQRNLRAREHDRVGCHAVTSTSKHGVYQAPPLHTHTRYCIYITI